MPRAQSKATYLENTVLHVVMTNLSFLKLQVFMCAMLYDVPWKSS